MVVWMSLFIPIPKSLYRLATSAALEAEAEATSNSLPRWLQTVVSASMAAAGPSPQRSTAQSQRTQRGSTMAAAPSQHRYQRGTTESFSSVTPANDGEEGASEGARGGGGGGEGDDNQEGDSGAAAAPGGVDSSVAPSVRGPGSGQTPRSGKGKSTAAVLDVEEEDIG